MTLRQFPVIFLLPILFLFSCGRNLYSPSIVYAPQFVDRGESEIGFNAGASTGVQAQGGYAATKHFAVQAEGSYLRKNSGTFHAGIDYRFMPGIDTANVLLISLGAGYAGGMYSHIFTEETGTATTGIAAQPGYLLYDMDARWHGGYFQYSLGARLERKLSFYTGTRIQWLNCEKFHYSTQFFAKDSAGNFSAGQIRTIDPSHGFTTTADVYLGAHFGWKHFHFFVQVQWHYQYNGVNLNNTWKPIGTGEIAGGCSFLFYPRKK